MAGTSCCIDLQKKRERKVKEGGKCGVGRGGGAQEGPGQGLGVGASGAQNLGTEFLSWEPGGGRVPGPGASLPPGKGVLNVHIYISICMLI